MPRQVFASNVLLSAGQGLLKSHARSRYTRVFTLPRPPHPLECRFGPPCARNPTRTDFPAPNHDGLLGPRRDGILLAYQRRRLLESLGLQNHHRTFFFLSARGVSVHGARQVAHHGDAPYVPRPRKRRHVAGGLVNQPRRDRRPGARRDPLLGGQHRQRGIERPEHLLHRENPGCLRGRGSGQGMGVDRGDGVDRSGVCRVRGVFRRLCRLG